MNTYLVNQVELESQGLDSLNTSPACASDPALVAAGLQQLKLGYDLTLLSQITSTPQLGGTAPSSLGSCGPFPSDPTESLPDWFTETIPSSYENPYLYPGQDIFTKLYRMIGWMKANPSNKLAAETYLRFLSNLGLSGTFNKYPKLLDYVMTVTDAKGNRLFNSAIDLVIQMQYYQTRSAEQSAFFAQLGAMFSSNDAMSVEIRSRVNSWSANWQDWVSKHSDPVTGPKYTYADYCIIGSGEWGSSILGANVSQWQKHLRLDQFDSVMHNPALQGNPMLLLMLLLFMLSDASSTDEISGYGETSSYMKDRTADVTKIVKDLTSGTFESTADAKAFMKEIHDLLFKINNSPLLSQNVKDQLNSQLHSILDQGAVDATGKPVMSTDVPPRQLKMDELYAGYTDNQGHIHNPDQASWNQLQVSLHYFKPVAERPVQTQYETMLQSLKASQACVTEQSQTITTMISQLSNNAQAIDNCLNKYLTSNVIDFEQKLVQHQIAG